MSAEAPASAPFVGLLYLFVSLFPIPFQLLVMFGIIKSKLVRSRPAYFIMFVLSVVETGQLLVHASTGGFLIARHEIPETVNAAMSHIMLPLWLSMVFLHVHLSMNRVLVITVNKCASTDGYCSYSNFLTFFCCVIGTVVGYGCHVDQMRFHLSIMAWASNPDSSWLVTALYYIQLLLPVVGIVNCLAIVCVIMRKRRRFQNHSNIIGSTEVRIFFHSSIAFFLTAANIFLWFPLNRLFDSVIIINVLVNLEWILICALPPFLTLIFNTEIRDTIIDSFGEKARIFLLTDHPKRNNKCKLLVNNGTGTPV
ncbi:unnamed protein product [Bursaphelenchus okinawaensis]|uniref:7TM_GPCR_Srx domain-containing protein n=1 Tax=Bursaphelenchus okinawaensis TaxID=465554 RepID=A0A811K1T4_9BILA|nr:unnamed protein product [Bursaphelenchus okinawaensis]CAG9090233.1 unnamed protein product [Bursaphelenchus okinawaensis]